MAFLNQTGLEHLWAKIVSKLSGKVDKEDGKGLSTNDYTDAEKTKLAGIATGANKTVVDSALSSTSTNPVQNKVINTEITDLKTLVGDTAVATQISTAITNQKGVANGVATLDSTGKVPSSQLPSYVDDVIEGYYSSSKFYTTKGSDGTYSGEITGETGKIYVDLNTNKTYRWSGSAYAVISETLALGTTSSTAFRGDYGNTAYTHATAKGSAFSSGLYKITTNAQGHVTAATAVAKSDITGLGIPAQDTTYSAATTSAAGLMSAADKTKLDGIATGATKVTIDSALSSTSTNPVQNKVVNTAITSLNTLVGDTAVATQISNAITSAASSTTPKVAGTAAVGTESTFARGDHVHPVQTTVSGNAGTATKLATARTIDGVSFNGSANITHYGTCDTTAATAEKTVSLTGFTLATGAKVAVKFTVTNTASSPTLNVNSTGAKAIYYRGAAITAGYLAANRVYEFVYDGTNYELIGDINVDTNTDTKVTNTLATTTKAYVTGTTSSSTNTGSQVFDTGVYLDTTAGQLTATTFKGALSGNASTATKATQDASGNVITSTYATKTELSDVSTLVGDTSVSAQISAAVDDCITGLSVSGKVITYTKGDGTTDTITTQDTNTTYSNATTSAAGLMSASDKTKLDGITASADSVSFTASATSGNKVGTITINGTATDMYSPTQTTVSGNAGTATALATTRYIDGVSFTGAANVTRYATCSTAAATAAKTASITAGTFSLITGARVTVKFTYANTVASPTLNVGSTGAKAIYWHGAALTSSQYWQANAVLDFVYNGTQWDLVGVAKDNNTTYSAATTSASGLMSATDKTTLDNLNTLVGDTAVSEQISAATDGCITGLSVSGKVITYTKGDGTTGTITTQDTNTTYSNATTSAAGLMSASDKTKLDGVATGAEVNQNAFSNIVVGTTTVAADSKTDTLTIVAGNNVTITPDATNDKITIAAADVAIMTNDEIDAICI